MDEVATWKWLLDRIYIMFRKMGEKMKQHKGTK